MLDGFVRALGLEAGLLLSAGSAQTPPVTPQAFQARLVESLGKHPFFSRISYELVGTTPYLFVVQKPAKEDPTYASRIATAYTQILDPTLESFESLVVTPLGLRQKLDHPLFVMAILASDGDFENYVQTTQASWHYSASSAYDLTLRAAIAHESPFQPRRDPKERVYSARHAFVHVLEQAHYEKSRAPVRGWLFEGLADLLSRFDPGSSTALHPAPQALKDLVLDALEQTWRAAYLRKLPEMFTVDEPDRLSSFLHVQTGLDLDRGDSARAWWAFYRQAALLVFYLHQAENGKYRAALHALLGATFRGEPAGSQLESALGETSPEAFDDAFLRWVIQEHRAAWPAVPVDVAAVLRVEKPPAPAADPGAAQPPLAAPPAPVVAPTPTPAEELAAARLVLSMLDATPSERFALALWNVRQGRIASGLATIEELFARDVDPALRARLERERARIAEWVRTRDGFFQRLLTEHQPLQVQVEGKHAKVTIARIEAGTLHLEPGRSGIGKLDVEALDPLELAQQMDSTAEGWARFYPYVLGGDERWKRLMKDAGEPARALREDAVRDYPARLQTGELAARLEELAARPEPRSPSEARRQLDELQAIPAGFPGLELSERRRPALAKLAQSLLGRLFDLEIPWTHLHARVEPLEDGRARLTYEFRDPAELEDFEALSYLKGYRKSYPLAGTHSDALAIEKDELRGSGQACLRSLFDLGVPLRVGYELAFEETNPRRDVGWFNVGICDDGQEHFAWGMNFHHLQVWDRGEESTASSDKKFVIGTPYSVELRHDGSRVTLSFEDELQQELPCTRSGGAVFLWLHSDVPVRVLRLEIEGKIDDSSFDRLRGAWILRRAALLFPPTVEAGTGNR